MGMHYETRVHHGQKQYRTSERGRWYKWTPEVGIAVMSGVAMQMVGDAMATGSRQERRRDRG